MKSNDLFESLVSESSFQLKKFWFWHFFSEILVFYAYFAEVKI